MTAIDRRAGGRHGGMTLIELLVVVVIVALGASLSVAWLGGGERGRLTTQIDRLDRDWQLAASVALGQQRVIGWRPLAEGYEFVAWQPAANGGRWVALDEDAALLPARQWADPVELSMSPPPNGEADQPWTVWWPQGEVLGGTLTLSSGETRRTLTLDASGVRQEPRDR